MIKFKLTASLLFYFSLVGVHAHAETDIERKAGIAGRYWGVVILADEFSKTTCGRTAKIDERYTNVRKAVSEIIVRFPKTMKVEMDQAFSNIEEQKARAEMRDLLVMMNLNKCDAAKSVIFSMINTAESDWRAIR